MENERYGERAPENNRVAAYVLIGVGTLFLLGNLNLGISWLWVGLLAAAFLAGYVRRRSYGLLVSGAALAGVAVGLLIGSWPAVLIGMGAGLWAASRVEPRSHRWLQRLAAVLAGIGLLGWFMSSGLFGSVALALLLVGSGLYLLRRPAKPSAVPDAYRAPVAPPQVQPASVQPATVQPASVQVPPVSAPGVQAPARATTPSAAARAAPAPSEPVVNEDAPQPVREGPLPQPLLEPGVAAPQPSSAAGLEVDGALAQALVAWRTRTAQAQQVPPYIVLTNATLRAVAQTRPQTLAELAAIKGIGPAKLERYGEAILHIVRDTPG